MDFRPPSPESPQSLDPKEISQTNAQVNNVQTSILDNMSELEKKIAEYQAAMKAARYLVKYDYASKKANPFEVFKSIQGKSKNFFKS